MVRSNCGFSRYPDPNFSHGLAPNFVHDLDPDFVHDLDPDFVRDLDLNFVRDLDPDFSLDPGKLHPDPQSLSSDTIRLLNPFKTGQEQIQSETEELNEQKRAK